MSGQGVVEEEVAAGVLVVGSVVEPMMLELVRAVGRSLDPDGEVLVAVVEVAALSCELLWRVVSAFFLESWRYLNGLVLSGKHISGLGAGEHFALGLGGGPGARSFAGVPLFQGAIPWVHVLQ